MEPYQFFLLVALIYAAPHYDKRRAFFWSGAGLFFAVLTFIMDFLK